MRLISSACLLLALVFNYTLVSAVLLDHPRRDSSPSTTSSAASATSPAPTPSSSEAAATSASPSVSASDDASAKGSQSSSASAASTTLVSITTSSSAVVSSATPSTANTANTTSSSDDILPLQPAITPAFSVAGTFLMISGLVYALIGIKNKWLHIYISAAYLVALAITVLIIYVMNPPVSSAIQGAYFVAAFIPGLGIGGLSLIFKDVTEGLGCAVGGFSLSMFFLILKPGGLLPGTASKAIFIGCWTVGIYALSFSHYVRSYALIGGTSLGGATAVILGIDCFSLAGLKEFWIYIWGLNDKLFPLLTDTYPITRGIRVEIAGIVVLTFVGVLSQMRIWKVVRERRQRMESERLEANRERDELEAELGRRLEDDNTRDREQWEHVYGKGINDSGIGTEASSTRKPSTSVETKGINGTAVETVEMDLLPASTAASEQGSNSNAGHQEKEKSLQVDAREVIATPESHPEPPTWTPERRIDSSLESQEVLQSGNSPPSVDSANPSNKTVHSGPDVVPLPFKVPAVTDEDDAASLATCASSKRGSKHFSHRFSGSFLTRKISQRSKRFSLQSSTSVEALTDGSPKDLNGLGSQEGSQVSVMSDKEDGNSQLEKLGLHDLRLSFEASVQARSQHSGIEKRTNTAETSMLQSEALPSKKLVETTNVASEPREGIEEQAASAIPLGINARTDASAHESSDRLNLPSDEEKVLKEMDPSTETSQNRMQRLSQVLPAESASKIVLQYRTNEWAKHLEKAEEPEFDDLDSLKPLVEEPSTILNTDELLQTPLTAEPSPAPATFGTRRSSTSSASSHALPPETKAPSRVPSFTIEDTSSYPKVMPSMSDVPRSSSRNSTKKPSRVSSFNNDSSRSSPRPRLPSKRSSSTPLANSTIDEDAEISFSPAPSPLPTTTLLGQRNTMLRNKSLTGSSRPVPSSIYPFTSEEGSSSPNLSQNPSSISLSPQDDNVPLSARRSYLQRASSTQSFHSATSPRLAPSPAPSSHHTYQHHTYQHQQPLRSPSSTDPTLRRTSMLAAWRSSLDQDMAAARVPEQEVQARREEMWQERAQERSQREREMNEAHREVLRRMQAGANKALGEGTSGV